ncbi:PLP-dependent aminotransferase family protein [Phreatobacter cathodiphilus]|uniref:GntR family transcriptional regulator n=1 Tax=Phreatobacter cathodiphilus TaxID=1868589 RepID=A0A2S0N8T6_9HYPH|nr:PLP-dependent aminotransferase family protein [Phreatobacter cathodiphilus]AVO44343.1 GntR family transcriptional regulator [Phreatobacter cathodiphilus]
MRQAAGSAETLTDRVIREVKDRLAQRALTPGTRLPSIRAFAAAMRVSKSTVVEAYERLSAEGLIVSRPGSGFYVDAPLAPLSLADLGPKLDQEVDPLWITRQSLGRNTELLMPGCGWLPASWMPQDSLRRALRMLARGDAVGLTDYGTPQGLPALRQFLVRRMAGQGVEASADQVVLTESGTQALDLACRFLVEPGDTVLVDDPCYFNFHALLRAHRAKVVSVPYTAQGPDLDLFEQALARHRPRLYVTNAGVHNPTGATLSPIVAHRLLKLAERADLTIVEDDIFADFETETTPRLAAFDGLHRVVYCGSFSKTLSAGLRCGFLVARPYWVQGLTDLKIATSFGGAGLAAEMVLAVLTDGSYRRHVGALRARLARARAETTEKLRDLGLTPWLQPQAGMFLWCRLPGDMDAAEVARRALADDVVLAPGNAFSLSQTARSHLRFNVAQCSNARIFSVLRKAIRAAS